MLPSPLFTRAARDNVERSHMALLALRDTLWQACHQAVRLEYLADDERQRTAAKALFFSLVDGPVAECIGALKDNEYYHGLDYPRKSFEYGEFVRMERVREILA